MIYGITFKIDINQGVNITMKKIKLAQKKTLKLQRLNLKQDITYFSGFCATDNKNFALFNVNEQFLVDKGFTDVLTFKLTEDDLWMLINRDYEIKPQIGILKVKFDTMGMVSRKHFDLLFSVCPQCKFYPVTEWFGKASNQLIVGLPDREGKPIGILKPVN